MKYTSIIITMLVLFACDWPFNTSNTKDEIFELSISHNIERVMPNAYVMLSWSEITVENFNYFKIERMLETDTIWTEVAELYNDFLTSYQDTITDDNDLIYRVGIVDIEKNIIWANNSTTIPRTTNMIIPDEFSTIQPAVNSKLIDDGDTIWVNPGVYEETISIAGKNIIVKSTDGYKNTFLFRTVLPDSIDQLRVVNILSGTLDGFSIQQGAPIHGSGGGISMGKNAIVQNCYIEGNSANSYKNGGYGGGVFIADDAKLYNNIITNNRCTRTLSMGIYALSAHGEIINNTIIGNDILIEGDCSGLLLRNNIVYNSNPDISFADESSKTGVTIDYSLFDYNLGFGSNNIFTDPQFIDNIDFFLSPNSPCIDAGHPDDQYTDIGGSRNDMGAYGGPRRR